MQHWLRTTQNMRYEAVFTWMCRLKFASAMNFELLSMQCKCALYVTSDQLTRMRWVFLFLFKCSPTALPQHSARYATKLPLTFSHEPYWIQQTKSRTSLQYSVISSRFSNILVLQTENLLCLYSGWKIIVYFLIWNLHCFS